MRHSYYIMSKIGEFNLSVCKIARLSMLFKLTSLSYSVIFSCGYNIGFLFPKDSFITFLAQFTHFPWDCFCVDSFQIDHEKKQDFMSIFLFSFYFQKTHVNLNWINPLVRNENKIYPDQFKSILAWFNAWSETNISKSILNNIYAAKEINASLQSQIYCFRLEKVSLNRFD